MSNCSYLGLTISHLLACQKCRKAGGKARGKQAAAAIGAQQFSIYWQAKNCRKAGGIKQLQLSQPEHIIAQC